MKGAQFKPLRDFPMSTIFFLSFSLLSLFDGKWKTLNCVYAESLDAWTWITNFMWHVCINGNHIRNNEYLMSEQECFRKIEKQMFTIVSLLILCVLWLCKLTGDERRWEKSYCYYLQKSNHFPWVKNLWSVINKSYYH